MCARRSLERALPLSISPGSLTLFFSTKVIGEGSGRGLGIARRIIEEHGGRIVVESQVGKGTQVSFLIPFSTPEEQREGTVT